MANPTSTSMSVKPSASSAVAPPAMSRLASVGGDTESSTASEALVEVLSATLSQAGTANGVRTVQVPGIVEPSHSLAHTAGAPVAVVLNSALEAGRGNVEPADAPPAPLGIGHAMPNKAHQSGLGGVDTSPLIPFPLEQASQSPTRLSASVVVLDKANVVRMRRTWS